MAKLIELKTFSDKRGKLTVIEDQIPFEVKRVFYIYDVDDSIRGGHRHRTTRQAAICISGSCVVSNNDGITKKEFHLNHPRKCLILETYDWHTMHHFSPNAVLLVFASTKFDSSDYIFEDYK